MSEFNFVTIDLSLSCDLRIYYNHDMTDIGKIALRTAVVERDPSLCELKFAV